MTDQAAALDFQELKASYDRDGFVAVTPLFGVDKMIEINREFDRYVLEVVPKMKREEVYYEDITNRSSLKQLGNMQLYDDYFRDLLESSVLREMAATALGEEAVPKNLQYFNKPAGIGKQTPAHQDGYYFHLAPCQALTGWMAFEPVDDENGCIHYVRGSHKNAGFRPHGRSEILGFSQGITDFGTEHDKANTVACPGDAGTVLMHNARTIHWAGANRSQTRSRRALGFVYFGKSAKVDEGAKAAYKAKLEADLKEQQKI